MVGYKVPAVVRTQLSSLATGLPTLKCSWYGITWSNIWLTHCSKKSESVIMEMFYIFTWYTCLKQNHSLWCHLTMFIFFPHTFFLPLEIHTLSEMQYCAISYAMLEQLFPKCRGQEMYNCMKYLWLLKWSLWMPMTWNCVELAVSILTAGLLYGEVHSHEKIKKKLFSLRRRALKPVLRYKLFYHL